jgi:hypothetical protein
MSLTKLGVGKECKPVDCQAKRLNKVLTEDFT